MELRKTKIVCSMGPTTEDIDVVCELLRSGMNVARFNFSHGDQVYHLAGINRVREASRITGIPCALLLDTKGPEIRTGIVPDDGVITVKVGERFLFTVDDGPVVPAQGTEPGRIPLSWKKLPAEIRPDCRILVADGLLDFLVLETDGSSVITAVAQNNGKIGSRKNVNVIGIHPEVPVLSEQDKLDIEFAIEHTMDYIAASFISSAADVVSLLRFIEPFESSIRVIAKIENEEGLNTINEIIAVSAGIMVARGDLGVQLETERIPLAQKQIIAACNAAGKPVITATQMLDSMISNPRPTRAELTDVANAIFDGTDAVMLSGETANGAYPVEAVRTLTKIACIVESSEEYREKMRRYHNGNCGHGTIAETVAYSAYKTATEIHAVAIVTPTLSGNTARLLSTFRPEQPIIAATPNETVRRQLLLNWGVFPQLVEMAEDSEEMIQNSLRSALDSGSLCQSDKVVLVAGLPIISPVMANTIRVLFVGSVIARGVNAGGGSDKNGFRATGRIVRAETPEEALAAFRKRGGEILVTRNLDMAFVPLLRLVNGLVIEQPTELSSEILSLINPELVWVSQVPGAMKVLEPGLTVTLDGKEKIVYEGTV